MMVANLATPGIRETVYKYLNCGDLKQGFERARYFCTSCHTKRAVAFAEWLHTTILLPVPHRQIVLTIPKMLRIYFRYDRRLLGEQKGLLSEERVRLLWSWENSGFNVNAAVRIGADDAAGRENLARSLIRAPFSMNKIRNFAIFDPQDFLVASSRAQRQISRGLELDSYGRRGENRPYQERNAVS